MTSINTGLQSYSYANYQSNLQSQNASKNPANTELQAKIAGIPGVDDSSIEASSVVSGVGQIIDILV
ncbi:MAG: hypothetical protein SFT90_05870 [Rickettsiales bacterium]|nr:hypothetical protein [Rickettsiales bacterium]